VHARAPVSIPGSCTTLSAAPDFGFEAARYRGRLRCDGRIHDGEAEDDRWTDRLF
jgi:hypothetical protein